MIGTLERPARKVPSGRVDVQINDLTGQQTLDLPGLEPETPISNVVGMTVSRMTLPPDIPWQARDNRTARLLRNDQAIGDVALESRAHLTLQPDATLGLG